MEQHISFISLSVVHVMALVKAYNEWTLNTHTKKMRQNPSYCTMENHFKAIEITKKIHFDI